MDTRSVTPRPLLRLLICCVVLCGAACCITVPVFAENQTGMAKLSCSGPSNNFSWTIVRDYGHRSVVWATLGPNYAGEAVRTLRWTQDEIDWDWGATRPQIHSWTVLNRLTGVLTFVFKPGKPQEMFRCQSVAARKF